MEDFDSIDSTDTWSEKWASSLEISEKFKESIKKASAKSQKVKKDEKKAKKYDLLLSSFLVKIILNKKYDNLVLSLVSCFDRWYPSNFLLWAFSLVYIDISKYIRKSLDKSFHEFNYKSDEVIEFSEEVVNQDIRKRINIWVEDMISVVIQEWSVITTRKLLVLLDKDEKILNDYFIGIFIFFFKEVNIIISEKEAFNYISFILWELKKSYRKYYFSNSIDDENDF